MVSGDGLLFIEPPGPASEEPVIDRLTRRMTAAFRAARPARAGWGSTCAAAGPPAPITITGCRAGR